MAITKTKKLDQVIIEPDTGTVLWREVTIIEEDGVELTRTYHRGSSPIDVQLPESAPEAVAPFKAMADTPQARATVEGHKVKQAEALNVKAE